MSDLYLVLRRRLEEVSRWAYIDTDILRTARVSRGLSYEAAARLIPTSSKTYERWEKAGRVPVGLVARIGELLDLEIERPARVRVAVAENEGEHVSDEIAVLRREMAALRSEVRTQNEEILRRLPEPVPGQSLEEAG